MFTFLFSAPKRSSCRPSLRNLGSSCAIPLHMRSSHPTNISSSITYRYFIRKFKLAKETDFSVKGGQTTSFDVVAPTTPAPDLPKLFVCEYCKTFFSKIENMEAHLKLVSHLKKLKENKLAKYCKLCGEYYYFNIITNEYEDHSNHYTHKWNKIVKLFGGSTNLIALLHPKVKVLAKTILQDSQKFIGTAYLFKVVRSPTTLHYFWCSACGFLSSCALEDAKATSLIPLQEIANHAASRIHVKNIIKLMDMKFLLASLEHFEREILQSEVRKLGHISKVDETFVLFKTVEKIVFPRISRSQINAHVIQENILMKNHYLPSMEENKLLLGDDPKSFFFQLITDLVEVANHKKEKLPVSTNDISDGKGFSSSKIGIPSLEISSGVKKMGSLEEKCQEAVSTNSEDLSEIKIISEKCKKSGTSITQKKEDSKKYIINEKNQKLPIRSGEPTKQAFKTETDISPCAKEKCSTSSSFLNKVDKRHQHHKHHHRSSLDAVKRSHSRTKEPVSKVNQVKDIDDRQIKRDVDNRSVQPPTKKIEVIQIDDEDDEDKSVHVVVKKDALSRSFGKSTNTSDYGRSESCKAEPKKAFTGCDNSLGSTRSVTGHSSFRKDVKVFHCKFCNVVFQDSKSVEIHSRKPSHYEKLTLADMSRFCAVCDVSFYFDIITEKFEEHEISIQHQWSLLLKNVKGIDNLIKVLGCKKKSLPSFLQKQNLQGLKFVVTVYCAYPYFKNPYYLCLCCGFSTYDHVVSKKLPHLIDTEIQRRNILKHLTSLSHLRASVKIIKSVMLGIVDSTYRNEFELVEKTSGGFAEVDNVKVMQNVFKKVCYILPESSNQMLTINTASIPLNLKDLPYEGASTMSFSQNGVSSYLIWLNRMGMDILSAYTLDGEPSSPKKSRYFNDDKVSFKITPSYSIPTLPGKKESSFECFSRQKSSTYSHPFEKFPGKTSNPFSSFQQRSFDYTEKNTSQPKYEEDKWPSHPKSSFGTSSKHESLNSSRWFDYKAACKKETLGDSSYETESYRANKSSNQFKDKKDALQKKKKESTRCPAVGKTEWYHRVEAKRERTLLNSPKRNLTMLSEERIKNVFLLAKTLIPSLPLVEVCLENFFDDDTVLTVFKLLHKIINLVFSSKEEQAYLLSMTECLDALYQTFLRKNEKNFLENSQFSIFLSNLEEYFQKKVVSSQSFVCEKSISAPTVLYSPYTNSNKVGNNLFPPSAPTSAYLPQGWQNVCLSMTPEKAREQQLQQPTCLSKSNADSGRMGSVDNPTITTLLNNLLSYQQKIMMDIVESNMSPDKQVKAILSLQKSINDMSKTYSAFMSERETALMNEVIQNQGILLDENFEKEQNQNNEAGSSGNANFSTPGSFGFDQGRKAEPPASVLLPSIPSFVPDLSSNQNRAYNYNSPFKSTPFLDRNAIAGSTFLNNMESTEINAGRSVFNKASPFTANNNSPSNYMNFPSNTTSSRYEVMNTNVQPSLPNPLLSQKFQQFDNKHASSNVNLNSNTLFHRMSSLTPSQGAGGMSYPWSPAPQGTFRDNDNSVSRSANTSTNNTNQTDVMAQTLAMIKALMTKKS